MSRGDLKSRMRIDAREDKLISGLRRYWDKKSAKRAVRYVQWWNKRQLPLPAKGTFGDHLLGAMLSRSDLARHVLGLLIHRLPDLTSLRGMLEFESERFTIDRLDFLTPKDEEQYWAYIKSRRGSTSTLAGVLLDWLATNLEPDAFVARFTTIFTADTDFGRATAAKAVTHLENQFSTDLHTRLRHYPNEWLRMWFARRAKTSFDNEEKFWGRLVTHILDQTTAEPLARLLTSSAAIRSIDIDLAVAIGERAPTAVAEAIVHAMGWHDPPIDNSRPLWEVHHYHTRVAVIRHFGPAVVRALGIQIGFALGVSAAENNIDLSTPQFWEHPQLSTFAPTSLDEQTIAQCRLWYWLARLKHQLKQSYGRESVMITGITSKLEELAYATPDVWAQAVRWILWYSDDLGTSVQALLLVTARDFPTVRANITQVQSWNQPSAIRERALGLCAMLGAFEQPDLALTKNLMTIAALLTDHLQLFPHPLELPSSTWLGSLGLEGPVRALTADAQRAFQGHFATRVGLDEDIHTALLLQELERHLGKQELYTTGLGEKRKRPLLAIAHRQTSKKTEEPNSGVDLALLITVNLQGTMSGAWAAFVQVKKPERKSIGAAEGVRWRIDMKQLADLSATSDTAIYWFIDHNGLLLTVPVKLVAALCAGKDPTGTSKALGSTTLHYYDIRMMAVPLAQCLIDLIVGGWIGDGNVRALAIANGTDPLIRPSYICTINVRYSDQEMH